MISSSEENPELEKQAIDQLLGRGVDVLLVASTQPTADSFHRVQEQKVPYILVDRCFSEFPANFVGVKDETVGPGMGMGSLSGVYAGLAEVGASLSSRGALREFKNVGFPL